jgi:hypothetical protein
VSEPEPPQSSVVAENGIIHLGRRATVSFHRTLRVPDDGRSYPLPPSFGRFPLYSCFAHRHRAPSTWNAARDFFVPLHQNEALWLGFDGEPWHPTVLVIGAEGVNVITGAPWDAPLARSPQNYVIVPDQPWLDGIRTRAGLVRQFVAMPPGQGITLSEQVEKRTPHRGIQLRAHEAKSGRFPDQAPPAPELIGPQVMRSQSSAPALGIAAGGTIAQKIYPDAHGFESWESDAAASAQVHIVNSAQFFEITAEAPPPSPISAADYTTSGLPWFELFDEARGDLGSQRILEQIKSIGDVDPAQRDRESPVRIPDRQIRKIRRQKPTRPRKR